MKPIERVLDDRTFHVAANRIYRSQRIEGTVDKRITAPLDVCRMITAGIRAEIRERLEPHKTA